MLLAATKYERVATTPGDAPPIVERCGQTRRHRRLVAIDTK